MKALIRSLLVGASLAGASLVACSSSTNATTTASESDGGNADAGPVAKDAQAAQRDVDAADASDAAPQDSAPADGACNNVVNDAPEATSSTVKGTHPTATGGTIAEGKYHLKEFILYDPNADASPAEPSGMKTTLVIKGNLLESVHEVAGYVSSFSETFTANGTALDRTLSCPKATPDLEAVYSVSGSTLTIYETDKQGAVAGSVYEKQ